MTTTSLSLLWSFTLHDYYLCIGECKTIIFTLKLFIWSIILSNIFLCLSHNFSPFKSIFSDWMNSVLIHYQKITKLIPQLLIPSYVGLLLLLLLFLNNLFLFNLLLSYLFKTFTLFIILHNTRFQEDRMASTHRFYGFSLYLFKFLIVKVLHLIGIGFFSLLLSLSVSFSVSQLFFEIMINCLSHKLTHIYLYETIWSTIR